MASSYLLFLIISTPCVTFFDVASGVVWLKSFQAAASAFAFCHFRSTTLLSRNSVILRPRPDHVKLSFNVPIPTFPIGVGNGVVDIIFSPNFCIVSQTLPIVPDAQIAANSINRIIPIPAEQMIIHENQFPVSQAQVFIVFGYLSTSPKISIESFASQAVHVVIVTHIDSNHWFNDGSLLL